MSSPPQCNISVKFQSETKKISLSMVYKKTHSVSLFWHCKFSLWTKRILVKHIQTTFLKRKIKLLKYHKSSTEKFLKTRLYFANYFWYCLTTQHICQQTTGKHSSEIQSKWEHHFVTFYSTLTTLQIYVPITRAANQSTEPVEGVIDKCMKVQT